MSSLSHSGKTGLPGSLEIGTRCGLQWCRPDACLARREPSRKHKGIFDRHIEICQASATLPGASASVFKHVKLFLREP
jgi:hypothetical protein